MDLYYVSDEAAINLAQIVSITKKKKGGYEMGAYFDDLDEYFCVIEMSNSTRFIFASKSSPAKFFFALIAGTN